tara:strand:- start:7306 stop:8781 length:1476 start_codon:yes stop_codon:yes gene_type:complete
VGHVNESGIEVDEAAEYFGATSSSDGLHAMLAMSREDAFVAFFRQLSDLVLQPGDFDFMEAGVRMACEGGELYYLVAGHLGLMSMSDPLRSFLGQEDSEGNAGTGGVTVSGSQLDALNHLCDPMRLMRLFAVANETGGEDEVRGYLRGLEGHFGDVATNETSLVQVAHDLEASLDVSGQILPVASLSGSSASATELELRAPAPIQTPAPKAPETPAPAAPLQTEPAPDAQVPLPPQVSDPGHVPLPNANETPIPDAAPAVADLDDRRKAEAAADAFAGAFGSMIAPPPAPEPVVEALPEEDEPVSDEERFLAADEDESGGLSVEELADATGTDLEEAARLHAAADVDGDGQVTMEEFVGSQAAEVASTLPRPVRLAPVRAPVAQQNPATQPAQPPVAMPQAQPRPMQPQQVGGGWPRQQRNMLGQQQQGWGQQPQQGWVQQPQQGWVQPQPMHNIPPTIPSGLRCPGCGVGIDGQWRYCPVCGTRNPAMMY